MSRRANSSRQRTSQPGRSAPAPQNTSDVFQPSPALAAQRRGAGAGRSSRRARPATRSAFRCRRDPRRPRGCTVAAVDLGGQRRCPSAACAGRSRRGHVAHRLGGRAGRAAIARAWASSLAQKARALPRHLRMGDHGLDLASATAPCGDQRVPARAAAPRRRSRTSLASPASRSSVTLIDPSSEFSIGTIAQLTSPLRSAMTVS